MCIRDSSSSIGLSGINCSVPETLMHSIRQPAVAGAFYPGQRQTLLNDVRDMLGAAGPGLDTVLSVPKAVIVPHAGYIYSGDTAALAYVHVAAGRNVIRRVVLLGPVHRVPVRGLALPGGDAFATPTEVAQVLEALWGGPETLLVVSSDLSHFLPYAVAQAVDQETVQHILSLEGS